MKYVIIGAGPAGVTAVKTILEEEPGSQITMISKEEILPYSRILLTYYLEGKIDRETLFLNKEIFQEMLQKPAFNFREGEEVVSVDFPRKLVITDQGEEIAYDKLLIASGGKPGRPSQPGMERKSVFTVRYIADVEEIKKEATRAREAVLLGGGMVSLKMVQALSKYDLKLTIVISSRQIMSQALDIEGAAVVAEHLRSQGIEIITGESAQAIIDEGNHKVVYLNSRKLKTDLVVIGKGVSPSIRFVNRYEIKVGRGLLVDEFLQTSVPGVYAAGDVAEAYCNLTDGPEVNAIWPNATEQGRIAALNMLGNSRSYSGSIPMNSIEVFGLPIISLGLVKDSRRGQGKEYKEISRSGNGNDFKKLIFYKDRLIGAVLIGDIRNAGVYRQLIKNKKKVDDQVALLDRNFRLVDYVVS